MKTLYITDTGKVLVDSETNSAEPFGQSRACLDGVYLAKENIHVVYKKGLVNKEMDVEQGDIIVAFYDTKATNRVVKVKSPEWEENIKNYEAEEQKIREEWAQKQKGCDNENCKKYED